MSLSFRLMIRHLKMLPWTLGNYTEDFLCFPDI